MKLRITMLVAALVAAGSGTADAGPLGAHGGYAATLLQLQRWALVRLRGAVFGISVPPASPI